MINLYEYIVSNDFVNDLSKDTSYTIITDGEKSKNTENIQWLSYHEVLEKEWKITLQWANILCIAINLTSKDILVLDNLFTISCTWINCNPWIISMIKKSHPEENDIVPLLERGYTVKEPINTQDILKSLHKKTYLRIFDIPLAQKLSTLHRDNGIAYIKGSQIQSHFTVLSTLSCSDSLSWALDTCSKWSDNIFELYLWSQISTELSKDIIHSIQRTQHIIIVIDHKATEELWLYCDTLIKQHCGNNITIQYIFPQFHLVSSILEDYLHEEAEFDQPAFEAYIMESIDHYNQKNQ